MNDDDLKKQIILYIKKQAEENEAIISPLENMIPYNKNKIMITLCRGNEFYTFMY